MQPDLFVLDDLRLLMEKQEKWCVSIFMPTHKVTPLVQEDGIRFKNLLREAEDKLKAVNADLSLEPAVRLMDDRAFWHHQSDGLAVFVGRDLFRPYRLPITLDELVVVSDRFHVKPALPLLAGDGRFYVLALSQNQARLLQCTRYGVNEVNLDDVPTSLEEALKFDEQEKQLQFHTGTPPGPGKRAAMFHGQGIGHDDAKDRILRYFQELDKGLQRILRGQRAPMVIAAVDYLLPIFKQASSYPYILDQIISGNPEEISVEELHSKANEIVVPRFEREIHDEIELYMELVDTDRASTNVEEVVKAASHGRINVLFVPVGTQRWGIFDATSDEVKFLSEEDEGGYDLLDYAAAQTVLNSGTVYALRREQMPEEALVAAVFRY